MDKRAPSSDRTHHDAVREAILKVFLVSRRLTEISFRDLWLQLDTDGCSILDESLEHYLEDMRDRGWLEFTARRTEKKLREIVRVRILPKGRDVFDGVVIDPGLPQPR